MTDQQMNPQSSYFCSDKSHQSTQTKHLYQRRRNRCQDSQNQQKETESSE